MSNDKAYYRADVPGLNPGDPTTRTLDPLGGKEYTYAATRLDVARGIAARHPGFDVYRVKLNEPIEVDPDAAQFAIGELFVRSPWGAVVDVAVRRVTIKNAKRRVPATTALREPTRSPRHHERNRPNRKPEFGVNGGPRPRNRL